MLSTIDVPAHDNSAMDGYAVRAADTDRRRTPDGAPGPRNRVGRPALPRPGRSRGVRADHDRRGDAVRRRRGGDPGEDRRPGLGETIRFEEHPRTGDNVREAGEDIPRGATVLDAGQRVGPAELGVLASLGTVEASVRRRVRVAFFSTGDELRSLGEPLAEGCIYDSNRYTLLAMLRAIGAEILDLGVVRDVREDVERAFREAAAAADAIVTSGGVSVGEADFVKETLERTGEVGFWKIAMKPGRPLAFGKVGGALFFGLPGNPGLRHGDVLPVRPAGPSPDDGRARGGAGPVPGADAPRACANGRDGWSSSVECSGRTTRPGASSVRSTGGQGSGILNSMHEANCFIVLPLESDGVEPGSEVDVEPFNGVTGAGM